MLETTHTSLSFLPMVVEKILVEEFFPFTLLKLVALVLIMVPWLHHAFVDDFTWWLPFQPIIILHYFKLHGKCGPWTLTLLLGESMVKYT
jgi:hypothetical protein